MAKFVRKGMGAFFLLSFAMGFGWFYLESEWMDSPVTPPPPK